MKFLLKKKILIPSFSVIFSLVLYYTIKKIINKFIVFKKIDNRKRNTIISIFNNFVRYTLIILCALIILDALGVETKAIITSLGVAGLVIGLSFQDILKDFIAGMFIILENQYAVGDHITIGTFRGEVISFGLKTTKILSYTGLIKTIPNRYVDQAINHSINNVIVKIKIPFPIDYNIEKTSELIIKTCKKISSNIKHEIKFYGVVSGTHLLNEYLLKVETTAAKEEDIKNLIFSEVKIEVHKNKEELIS